MWDVELKIGEIQRRYAIKSWTTDDNDVSLHQQPNFSIITMISKESIETAYCFLHQKLRVYQYSTMDWQKDDIEYAIGNYVADIPAELLALLSNGKADFLVDHKRFQADMTEAVEQLEQMLGI